MAKRVYNICPITGQEIRDRTYNRKAKYSKEGYKIMREQYKQEHSRIYYALGKLVGVGFVKGEEDASRNFTTIK
jgi:DNA-binding PadR family transcriptional regulator